MEKQTKSSWPRSTIGRGITGHWGEVRDVWGKSLTRGVMSPMTATSLGYKCPLVSVTDWIGGTILSIRVNHLPLIDAAGWVVDLKFLKDWWWKWLHGREFILNECPSCEMWHFSLSVSSCSRTIKDKEPRIYLFCPQMNKPKVQTKLGLNFKSKRVPLVVGQGRKFQTNLKPLSANSPCSWFSLAQMGVLNYTKSRIL